MLLVIVPCALAYVWWDYLPPQITSALSEWTQLGTYSAGHIGSDELKVLTPQLTPKRDCRPEELMGLWQEKQTLHFVRFTDVKAEEDVYCIGCEWDEAEDVHEADLEYLGNGYFLWRVQDGQLTMIHQLNKGLAEIPKVHTLIRVTSTELSYKDTYGSTLHFIKAEQ